MSKHTFTRDFMRVTTPSGRVAFEAHTCIWKEENIAISAPTLKQLAEAWKKIVGTEFSAEATNHTYVTLISKFEDRSDNSL